MENKIKLNFQGRDVWAERIPVRSSHENWNEYFLDDGTVLKIKLVATEVLRLDGHFDQEGNPVYLLKSTNVISAMAPDALKRKEG